MILLFLASCTTVSDPAQSGTDESGVTALIRDIVSSAGEKALTGADLEKALDSSYRAYSGYIPSYDEIKNRYLSSLVVTVSEAMAEIFPSTVLAAGEEIGNNPSPYLSGELVTPSLEAATREILTENLTQYLVERREKLEEAFTESRDTFSRVKKAYAALSAVSKGVVLAEAEEAEAESLASAAVERYFSLLEEEEREKRSSPLSGGSRLYLEH